ncbi:MAG TPA: diguanylate cyclase [Polyangiaceae bacterium]
MDGEQPRIILVDVSEASRDVLAQRLTAQGYAVEALADPVMAADMALMAPPAAVVADLWMPSISGVQLCRLLKAEPATVEVPVILRGESDDPRSRFWAERAGAAAYVRKGGMGELVRVLARVALVATDSDGFFTQLNGGSVDIRDRIARHLDAALFDSVIAAEVRSLAACGSFERLFDLFAQFLCQVVGYRWLAVATASPRQFAMHHHPGHTEAAEREARAALAITHEIPIFRVVDEDARDEATGPEAVISGIPFGALQLGSLALGPSSRDETDTESLVRLVAQELGGPIRIAALMDEQQRLASVDPLTGLRNRRAFLEQINVEIARASRYGTTLSFLLLDVDHFKSINDHHGHAGGDSVLSSLGKVLGQQLRTPDLPARWGGEEFVVALTNTDLGGACIAAERIRAAVEEMLVEHDGARVPVTVSVGVATLRRGESLDALIDRADHAMYAAKCAGRNRVMTDAEDGPVETPATLSEISA